jgi:hypothetical protein
MAKSTVRGLDGEELEKVRNLLTKLDNHHLPSFDEMEALRDFLANPELRAVLERERNRKLMGQIKLQFYRTVGAVLATIATIGGLVLTFQSLLEKWFSK